MVSLNPKERIKRIFSHLEADRPLKDFGGTVVTSITKSAYINVLNFLGLNHNENDIKIIDRSMATVAPSEKILKKLNVDFRLVALEDNPVITNNTFKTALGIVLRQARPYDYFDVIYNPLKDMDIDKIKKYGWPRIVDKSIFIKMKDIAEDLYKNSHYGIVGQMGPSNFYERGQMLRGYEQFGVDLLLNPEIVKVIFDNLLAIQKEYYKYYLNAAGRYLDVIFYADDLGMQDRPQISPKTYKEVIKPYHK
jgi:uroporphyrinogen decarboxylase